MYYTETASDAIIYVGARAGRMHGTMAAPCVRVPGVATRRRYTIYRIDPKRSAAASVRRNPLRT